MGPPDRVAAAARPGHAAVRVVGHGGVRWRVYEGRLGLYDRRSGPHLFSESEYAVRRVRGFPPNWFTLPDAELMALSERH